MMRSAGSGNEAGMAGSCGNDGLTIRKMVRADLTQVAAIEQVSIQSPWSEKSFAESIESPLYLFVVAQEDERVLGYVGAQLSFEDAEITSVAVDPQARGRGIGRALMRALAKEAKKRGAEQIFLEVRESNAPAIALYLTEGYEQLAVKKNFYRFPTENGLFMRKGLL